MIRTLLPTLMLAAAACTPQYVVMNNTPAHATAVSGQATTYPDLTASPAGPQKTGNVAVIVAIEEYAFLPAVPGAIDNAVAWENYLRTTRGFSDVYVLTNKQAPIEEIRRFAQQAASTAPAGSELWFVFIGHGAALKDGTDGALIGMDAQQTIESIGTRSIAQNDLLKTLHAGTQARTVLVLDTCFSGRDAEGELLAVGTQPVIAVDHTAQVNAGTVILSAAGNDEVAGQLPGSARPAFSYLLLGALRGWADDGDGHVTAQEAIHWTQQQMRHLPGRQQTPSVAGDRNLVLAASLGEADPGIANLFRAGGAVQSGSTTATNTLATGTRIDTQKGMTFVKSEEWGVGPTFGTVLALTHQYTGAMIAVHRVKTSQANASFYLGVPKAQFEGDRVDLQRGPNRVTYGTTSGQESEFKNYSGTTENTDHIIRFATYQHGAAWVIDLFLPSPDVRDASYASLQEFLETVTFY